MTRGIPSNSADLGALPPISRPFPGALERLFAPCPRRVGGLVGVGASQAAKRGRGSRGRSPQVPAMPPRKRTIVEFFAPLGLGGGTTQPKRPRSGVGVGAGDAERSESVTGAGEEEGMPRGGATKGGGGVDLRKEAARPAAFRAWIAGLGFGRGFDCGVRAVPPLCPGPSVGPGTFAEDAPPEEAAVLPVVAPLRGPWLSPKGSSKASMVHIVLWADAQAERIRADPSTRRCLTPRTQAGVSTSAP